MDRDDDPFDIEPVGSAHDGDDDPFDIEEAGAGSSEPVGDRHWYDDLLDIGKSVADGVSLHGSLSLHNQEPTEGEGAGITQYRDDVKRARVDHPYANAAGEIATNMALGRAAGPGIAAQESAAGLAGAASEYGESHDPLSAVGAGAAGAAMSRAGNATMDALPSPFAGSPKRQEGAIRRMLTDGDRKGANALDELLGGDRTGGTAGQGLKSAVDRARQLSGGSNIDLEKLQSAANQSTTEALSGPLYSLQQQAPGAFNKYRQAIGNLTRDPTGGAFATKGMVPKARLARDQLLGVDPSAGPALQQYATDSVLSGIGSAGPTTFSDLVQKGNLTGAALKMGGRALDRAAFGLSSGTRANMRGATGAALNEEAGDWGARGAVGTREALKLKAGAPTLEWTLQSVLSSGDTGLEPQDEQRLTEAVINGDLRKIAALDYQLKQRSPGYAKRIEDELRSLNDEEY